MKLDHQGLVVSDANSNEVGHMKEDMVSNALLWIFSKIINYVALRDSAGDNGQRGSQSQHLLDLTSLQERWDRLSMELDVWSSGLSEQFQPLARCVLPEHEHSTTEGDLTSTVYTNSPLSCIWYSNKMCASTIQTYHLARIVLLVNKPGKAVPFHTPPSKAMAAAGIPTRQGTISAYLDSLREQQAELQYRAREICGIALSSPTKACIYLHQTQTLFVAGQCLSGSDERRIIIDLLRKVDTELGWETEYRVEQLLAEWQCR